MKEGIPDNIERRKCLFLWRALSNIWPLLRENLYGSIGDGNEIRCWQDPWVPGVGPLVKQISSHGNLDLECTLKELVTESGALNLDLFRFGTKETII